jgi:hypothetical protein
VSTRREASEKVAKLRRLASSTKSPEEAETARRTADKMIAEHGLTEHELDEGNLAEAHDDLLRELETAVSSRSSAVGDAFGTVGLVSEVVEKLRSTSPENKASRLRTAATVIRTLAFVSSRKGLAAEAKKCLELVLDKHGVKV